MTSRGSWSADMAIGDADLQGPAFKKLRVYGDATGTWDIWSDLGKIDIRGVDTVNYILHAV